eukprot:CAMPEP_0119018202 /NCGR_PEP_ID=MMETSP1176-20130426/18805_1 /TAXON_ID=265551 /ORGANISM="Synedropsis recta cf, Strain CCMP1620" /LENGTH=147 /DNA_ID=CAMNT_0006972151 /DNA_START=119 /DNA_END=558 /DNA_ORIENTATION=-
MTSSPPVTKAPRKDLHAHEIDKVYGVHSELALEEYKKVHAESIANPSKFWADKATTLLDWIAPFHTPMAGGLEHGDVSWFQGGKLNVCYNAMDRHVVNVNVNANVNASRTAAASGIEHAANEYALIWEGDEPNDIRRLTYPTLLRKT